MHSRLFEIEVLDFFANAWEISREDYWGAWGTKAPATWFSSKWVLVAREGYTTTCGTEGNLLGILYGREKLPDALLYYSKDSHYSVPKAGKLYRIPLVRAALACARRRG